jgi:hypothetical protein
LFDLDDVGSQSHDFSIHFLFLWLFYVGGKFNVCIAPTDWPLLLFICIVGYPNSSEPLPSKKPLDRWWLKCLKWFFKISQSRVFFMVSLSFSFSDYLFDLRLLKLAVCSSLFYSWVPKLVLVSDLDKTIKLRSLHLKRVTLNNIWWLSHHSEKWWTSSVGIMTFHSQYDGKVIEFQGSSHHQPVYIQIPTTYPYANHGAGIWIPT